MHSLLPVIEPTTTIADETKHAERVATFRVLCSLTGISTIVLDCRHQDNTSKDVVENVQQQVQPFCLQQQRQGVVSAWRVTRHWFCLMVLSLVGGMATTESMKLIAINNNHWSSSQFSCGYTNRFAWFLR